MSQWVVILYFAFSNIFILILLFHLILNNSIFIPVDLWNQGSFLLSNQNNYSEKVDVIDWVCKRISFGMTPHSLSFNIHPKFFILEGEIRGLSMYYFVRSDELFYTYTFPLFFRVLFILILSLSFSFIHVSCLL